MDRFIVFGILQKPLRSLCLKSNMDRFIEVAEMFLYVSSKFKIQYG